MFSESVTVGMGLRAEDGVALGVNDDLLEGDELGELDARDAPVGFIEGLIDGMNDGTVVETGVGGGVSYPPMIRSM